MRSHLALHMRRQVLLVSPPLNPAQHNLPKRFAELRRRIRRIELTELKQERRPRDYAGVNFIFISSGMKAAEVSFDCNLEECALSNWPRFLDPDLIGGCPRANQTIRQCNANFAIRPPSSALSARRRFFKHIAERIGRGRLELH